MPRTTRAAVAAPATPKKSTAKAETKKGAKAKNVKSTAKGKTASSEDEDVKVKEEPPNTPANTSKKRARAAVKYEEEASDVEEKPSTKRTKTSSKATPKSKSKPKAKAKIEPDLEAGAKLAANLTGDSPKKTKSNPYNLSPGESPYPTYQHPTPSECQHVADLLSAIHGNITAPKTISAPSLTSSGCGEVPSVLDALVRTRLSAATNNANSSRAFRGLIDRFGTLKSGVGKGSVDWDAVRHTDVKEVFTAIQSGGLADVKSRDIKKILDLVHAENEEARKEGKEGAPPEGVLSLDHLHGMGSDDAFNKLLAYPGIGPKTASCVLLFCMQRPSFAVDTHVFRLTRWLGWTPSESQIRAMAKGVSTPSKAGVKDEEDGEEEAKPTTPSRARKPPPVTRNSTYSHLDVRIPDELKYALHYLLIKHGKMCPSCSAKKDKAIRAAWGGKECPIKDLKVKSKKKVLVETGEANEEDDEDEGDDGDDVKSESDEEGEEEEGEETMHGLDVK